MKEWFKVALRRLLLIMHFFGWAMFVFIACTWGVMVGLTGSQEVGILMILAGGFVLIFGSHGAVKSAERARDDE